MTLTAHDVRRMKACSVCGEIGIYKPLKAEVQVPIVICTNLLRAPGRMADFQHPTCYAGASVTKLMILEPEERDFIRLSDVTLEQMKGLLAASANDTSRGRR